MKLNSFESLNKLWGRCFERCSLLVSKARLAIAACAIAVPCGVAISAQAAPQAPSSASWREAVEQVDSGVVNIDAIALNDFGSQRVSDSIKFSPPVSGNAEIVSKESGSQPANNCNYSIADSWGMPKSQSFTQFSADAHKVSSWWRTMAFGLAGALISMLTVLLTPIIREIAQDIVWAIRGRIGSRIDVEDVTSLMVSRELARRFDPDSTHKW